MSGKEGSEIGERSARALGVLRAGGRRVVVESPFAGATPEDCEANVAYARAAVRDCLLRGEAPFASHLIYTQEGILDDDDPVQRTLGIEAGLLLVDLCEATVVYSDRGVSKGMLLGMERAAADGRPIETRSLPEWRNGAVPVRAGAGARPPSP